MIRLNLTPNEVAKLELFAEIESVLYDGVSESSFMEKATERELKALQMSIDKKTYAIYRLLGMKRIHEKAGYSPRYI